MKRLVLMALAICMTLGMVANASAIEIKNSGYFRFDFGFQDNGDFFDSEDDGESEDTFHARQKFNLNFKIIASDNGRGFHAGATEQFLTPQGGFGLFSVRERMADFGGAVEISSEPGQGTHVILRVPVNL